MNRYAVGLDGGGTKTAAVLCAPDGRTLERRTFGPMNRNGGEEAVKKTLKDCFAWLESQPGGLAACGAVCAGSAGISNPDAYQFLVDGIRSCGYSGALQLVGDQVTALAGALGKPVGTVLIAGTGSICYARTADGRERRTGGWGHLIDDEGSGYALGRDILRAVVRAGDGRGAKTVLTDLVAERLGGAGAAQVIRFTYAPDTTKKEIASLATLLDPALAKDDTVAKEILAYAAQQLAAMVAAAVRPLELQAGQVALRGSVLEKNAAVRGALQKKLLADFPLMTFPAALGDAADGAGAMAVQMLNEKEKNDNA